MTSTRWPIATKDQPCVVCGHTHGCRNAPDGTAAACFNDGNNGKVIQLQKQNGHAGRNLNGTSTYNGNGHKRPGGKAHPTAEAAIKASAWNLKDASLSGDWTYPGGSFKIARFDFSDGRPKAVRPVHLTDGGWKVGDPPGKLPLYRSDEIPADAEIIFVTEGEKCCDLARSIGLVTVTSSHGAGSAGRSDWSAIAGLGVVIVFLPDCDPAGEKYVADACRIIFQQNQTAQIKIVRLPELPPGGDIEQFIEARDSQETEAIAGAIMHLAGDAQFVQPGDVQQSTEDQSTPPIRPTFRTIAQLSTAFPELKRVLIFGMAREQEIINLIGASKTMKTWLAQMLGICVAVGSEFLGRQCEQRRVLYLDNELHEETESFRLRKIVEAMGHTADGVGENFVIDNFRGRLITIDDLDLYLRQIAFGTFGLIIIDALYKFLPEGTDENDNAAMAAIYCRLDNFAKLTGAAFLIVHHSSKGIQGGKSVTDVGSGAGSISRSADTHIVLRAHEQPGVCVMDAVTRSWGQVQPVCLDWSYPLWTLAPDLDPTLLKRERAGGRPPKDKQKPPEDGRTVYTPESFTDAFVTEVPQSKDLILAKLRQLKVPIRDAQDLLVLAESQKLIFPHKLSGNRTTFYSTKEQGLFAEVGASGSRARAPHTPQSKRRKKRRDSGN